MKNPFASLDRSIGRPHTTAQLGRASLGVAAILAATGVTALGDAAAAFNAGLGSSKAALGARTQDAGDHVAAFTTLARTHPDLVRVIRPSSDDPDFIVVAIESPDDTPDHSGPALLIVAGLDGRHLIGTHAALAMAESFVADPDSLAGHTVYLVPRIVEPGLASGRVAVADDADHDGRTDEDGPTDLDGDGVVRMMRLENPSPLLGLTPTHVIDADDPRRMREPEDGEVATHVLLPEGRDIDGDGQIAEDGPGGVDANADWPAHWPEFSDGVAGWALSLPRTRALADWVLATESIAAVLVLGPGDSLASVPVTRGAGPTGRVPEGLLSADEDAHTLVSERFRELTGIAGGERGPRTPGSLDAWAYGHLGLWSFATPLWDQPDRMGDLARVAAATPEDGSVAGNGDGDGNGDADAESSEGAGAEAEAEAGRRAPASDDADSAWLAWIDEDRDGVGFQPWTAVDHPSLGAVEVGGFDPGLRVDPPAELHDAIADAAARFTADLIGMMPSLEITRAEGRTLDGDLREIAVEVRNGGELPTRPAMAARTRRLTPTLVRLSITDDERLAGPRLARLERLEAGETVVFRWRARVPAGTPITVTLTDPIHGRLTADVSMREED